MRLLALLAAIALPPLLVAAPVPKDKEKEGAAYFPTTVGAKRVMELTTGNNTTEYTEVVTKAVEKDGVYTVTVEASSAKSQPATRVYEVTSAKVRQVEETVGSTTTPIERVVIDLGMKAGEGWTKEFELPGLTPQSKSIKVVQTYTQGKAEEVEVPAGKFTAIPVTEESQSIKYTRWYAPGVGLVKEEKEWMKRKTVKVLKAFTPGKEDKKEEKKVKDEGAIMGVWKVEKYDVGLPDTERTDRATKMVMTFKKGGKLTMSFNGADVEMEYKIDPTGKPKTIDMTRDGNTVPALYELDGDTLTICAQAGAKEGQKFVRPDGLKADFKKDVTLMTLKRVKDEPKKDK